MSQEPQQMFTFTASYLFETILKNIMISNSSTANYAYTVNYGT